MGNKATGSHIKDHPAILSYDEIQPETENGIVADLDAALEIVESKKKQVQSKPTPPTASFSSAG